MPSGIGCSHLRLAGTKWCCIANRQMTVSMLPEALVVCPVNAFVLDISGIFSAKTRFRAALSLRSLLGVPVPWAFT